MKTIRDFYDKVVGIPERINLITEDDRHPWMGNINDAPEEVLNTEFKTVSIHFRSDYQQVIFYI